MGIALHEMEMGILLPSDLQHGQAEVHADSDSGLDGMQEIAGAASHLEDAFAGGHDELQKRAQLAIVIPVPGFETIPAGRQGIKNRAPDCRVPLSPRQDPIPVAART
jgi:hypothetical protein